MLEKSSRTGEAAAVLAQALEDPNHPLRQVLICGALQAGAAVCMDFIGYPPLWGSKSSSSKSP
jgi:hypothetical protein